MSLVIALFIQGVLSFFSPCILAIIPIYMGYLTTGAKTEDDQGNVSYNKKKVLLSTMAFVLGISTVFFIAGLSLSAIRGWIVEYQFMITITGGFIMIFMGLFHLEIISIPFLNQEKRLNKTMKSGKMNFINAFLLGFLFSFAWTPCIGPLLSSALILSASATSAWLGNMYILSYTVGFVVSFMILGLFTEQILNVFKRKQSLMKIIVKFGGILILGIGIWMIGTTYRDILIFQSNHNHTEVSPVVEGKNDMETYNFTLEDQNGKTHTLSEYLGQPVLVTFSATWCPYCAEQMEIYKTLMQTQEVQILVIVSPNYNNEKDKDYILNYIQENNLGELTFLFGNQALVQKYQVTGYPTSFVYKSDGSLMGYLPGAASEETLVDLIAQAK